MRRGNWVGGRWGAAARGREFEVGGRTGGLERWARSGPEDAQEALRACAEAANAWGRLARSERVAALRRVAAALDTGAVSAALAPDLGLDPGELRGRVDEELFRFTEALELFVEGPEERGVGVFCAHWSDFVGGLGMRLARGLAAGRAFVLRSDRRLPRAAQLFAEAVERAELSCAPLALLHGDQPDLDLALTGDSRAATVRVREVDSVLSSLLPRVRARAETIWELWRVANASAALEPDIDPAEAAARCVERFVGRSTTLSGQCPGVLARVLCP